MSKQHNVEVSVPVHPDNDWHVPELIQRMWRAGEVHDALSALGFVATAFDPNVLDGNGEQIRLDRSRRWVKGNLALRVPTDRMQVVSPYLVACVVGAMADGV